MVKDEARAFVKNIVDVEKFISNPQDAKDKEILLSRDDMIKKILFFVEFWKEKKASK